MEMIWVWLAVVAVSLIVEFLSFDLTSIWFAVAGMVSLILSAIEGVSWEVQLVVFIVLSAVLLIFIRKICRKTLLKNTNTKTNVDAYAGKRTKLLKEIGTDENFGEVKFNGVVWQAMSENNLALPQNTDVEIVRVEGNKMIVRAIDNATTNSGNATLSSETKTADKGSNDKNASKSIANANKKSENANKTKNTNNKTKNASETKTDSEKNAKDESLSDDASLLSEENSSDD